MSSAEGRERVVGFFFGFVSRPGSKLSSSESCSGSGSGSGSLGLALMIAKSSINLCSFSAAAACQKQARPHENVKKLHEAQLVT